MKRKFFQLEQKSLQEFGATTQKDLWEKVKANGYDGLSISCKTVLTKEADNKFHAVFSTDSEDRHGDVVEQNWDLKSFKKNPVYLDSHNYDSIEYIIGRIKGISSKNGPLEGDVEFALKNPRGKLAHDLAEDGFLNTSSVGFIPKEFDDKGRIIKSELLEISGVSVPANPEALFEKDYEPNNDQDPETPEIDEQSPAPDSDSGEGGGGDDQSGDENPAGNEDGGGYDEPAPESNEPAGSTEPIKESPEKIVASAIKSLVEESQKRQDRKLFLLKSVAQVVSALGEHRKVETPAKGRAEEKRIINSVIRQLIKQKYQ